MGFWRDDGLNIKSVPCTFLTPKKYQKSVGGKSASGSFVYYDKESDADFSPKPPGGLFMGVS